VSGLATKTSAVEWLLKSIFTHFPAQKGSVAAVCFNVKGPDLCYLDQPGDIDEADRALYEKCGVVPEPFGDVQYFAPYKSDGVSLNTLRSNESLLDNVTALTWGLREVLQYAEVLLNKDDVDAKADALIDFIKENVLDKKFVDPMLERTHSVTSFADLDAWFRDVLRGLEKKDDQSWRTHHVATIRKVRNRLSNISLRCKGLVADDGATSDLPFGSFQDRTVYVIDVAGLEEDAQDLIFARVVTKLREHLEKRDLGVQHVVVFVDELNKYAPGDGPETYVRKMLLDIAERGRYLGLVLFSAQQFRSQVHRRVVGNSGTALYGRMDGDELATPGYAVLSPAIKTKLATLEKGQLMVRHPHFTQPIFVRFPRPAVMRGRDGVSQYPSAQSVSLHAAVLRTLRVLDPSLTLGWLQDVTQLATDDEILRARNDVVRTRPADVRKTFAAHFRAAVVPRTASRPHAPAPLPAVPSDDPYGF
ncbi:MAG: ATP-binding protein, partial [Gemmatimonadetes bacterium]|nr:ATP-binding protein [Gemmatimonadota bacterium]